MNFVAMAEDIRGHLGIPETGLVAEVNTGLQHLAHGSTHLIITDWVKPPPGRVTPQVLIADVTLSVPSVWISVQEHPGQVRHSSWPAPVYASSTRGGVQGSVRRRRVARASNHRIGQKVGAGDTAPRPYAVKMRLFPISSIAHALFAKNP
jgi:hypothetical protein